MMTKICAMVSGEPALESPTIDVSSKEFHGKERDDSDKISTCTNIKKKELEFNILLFDANKAEMSTMHTLESYSHLLVSIPFVIGIGDMMLQHIEFLKSTLMDWNLQWLCYLSSTNVYGVCRGVYVVNGYPTSTTNEMVLRLAVEQEWLNLVLDIGLKTHVFRLGDCQALKASTCIQLSQRIYNIIDDDPTSQGKVFAYTLDLVEKKWHCPTKKITCHESVESFVQKASLRTEKQATTTTLSFSNFKDIATTLTFSSSRARSNILIRLKQIATKEISSMCQATKEKYAGVLMVIMSCILSMNQRVLPLFMVLTKKTIKVGEKNVVVFDRSDSTFGVFLPTILEDVFEVETTVGDTHLGTLRTRMVKVRMMGAECFGYGGNGLGDEWRLWFNGGCCAGPTVAVAV
ncbi:hypothetical protein V6N12_007564 [Hibiscus sabdariffa]|uniref:Uncharacterized protein n=1 Tax=Hibiscus sabdariffa TaxID=183260 RepID=A0ABR2F277_9ROSI